MNDASPAQQLVGAVLNGRWRLTRLLGEETVRRWYEEYPVRYSGTRMSELARDSRRFAKVDDL